MERTVYFRAFEPEDANSFYIWQNDDQTNALTVGLNRKKSRADVQAWVDSKITHNPFCVYWAICSKETNQIIGYTCLTEIHYINSSANFGAIVIGDKDYRDGFAWMETYLFVMEYAFDSLNLNRLYGYSLLGHKTSNYAEDLFFLQREGLLRQAAYKNGRYYDISCVSILRGEYFMHKELGDYEYKAILKRLRSIRK